MSTIFPIFVQNDSPISPTHGKSKDNFPKNFHKDPERKTLTCQEVMQEMQRVESLDRWIKTIETPLKGMSTINSAAASPIIKKTKKIYDGCVKTQSTPSWVEIVSLIPDLVKKIQKDKESSSNT